MSALTGLQLAALARMRWQMLRNSLRTGHGRFELAARILTVALFCLVFGLSSVGLGYGAWRITSDGSPLFLTIVLWPVFVMWQVIPVMLASFQERTDLSMLLRFPISFRSYAALHLLSGVFDLSAIAGGMALLAIGFGITLAEPGLALLAAGALTAYAAFNFVLTQLIFAWLDKWLGQRKARRILGLSFAVVLVAAPMLRSQILRMLEEVQPFTPIGLSANVIAAQDLRHALTPLGLTILFTVVLGSLLMFRLQAQFRGESVQVITARAHSNERAKQGSNQEATGKANELPTLRSTIRIVFAKEVRYLTRTGVLLFGIAAPLAFLFFAGDPEWATRREAHLLALPLVSAFAFLSLTRQMCNSLGNEGAGVQLYLLAPSAIRTIVLAKNLYQATLFLLEVIFAAAVVTYRFGWPTPESVAITCSWLAFALPCQLALANLLSLTRPYKMTLTRISQEPGSSANGLLALLFQAVVVAVGAAAYLGFTRAGAGQWAPVFLLALGLCALVFYLAVLFQVDRMAFARRGKILGALVRI